MSLLHGISLNKGVLALSIVLLFLYPEVLNDPNVNIDYSTLMYIDHMSYNSVHAASVARSSAESYSSGGGGFSSGGGGGGSFGGGGGGGGGFR